MFDHHSNDSADGIFTYTYSRCCKYGSSSSSSSSSCCCCRIRYCSGGSGVLVVGICNSSRVAQVLLVLIVLLVTVRYV